MNRKTLYTFALTLLLASATHANQQQLTTSISEARAETARTSEQLKATLASLNTLTRQTKGDLRPAYNAFVTEVGKTESAAVVTRARVQWMEGDGRIYFKDWQNTVNAISNESLRNKAQKRLNAVQTSFNKVEASLKQAGEKFKPFLSDLSDIQKSLASDITAGGVKAIRGTVRTANWNHQFVNSAVNSALKEMGKMQKALSSEAQ